MAISNFVETAIKMQIAGNGEIALTLICSALDSTAKKTYIKKNNAERNKLIISENLHVISKYGFPGINATSIRIKCINAPKELKPDTNGYVGIEDIIYGVIRCSLIHECDIAEKIKFTENTMISDFDTIFRIPKDLFWGLTYCILLHPMNSNEIWEAETQSYLSKIK